MRLSNFILDFQRIAQSDISDGDIFKCESSTTGSSGETLRPKLDDIRLFQGATLEHVNDPGGSATNARFLNTIVSGTVIRENIWSGDRLTMTGSFSGYQDSSDSAFAVQILMVSDSMYTG